MLPIHFAQPCVIIQMNVTQLDILVKNLTEGLVYKYVVCVSVYVCVCKCDFNLWPPKTMKDIDE